MTLSFLGDVVFAAGLMVVGLAILLARSLWNRGLV